MFANNLLPKVSQLEKPRVRVERGLQSYDSEGMSTGKPLIGVLNAVSLSITHTSFNPTLIPLPLFPIWSPFYIAAW